MDTYLIKNQGKYYFPILFFWLLAVFQRSFLGNFSVFHFPFDIYLTCVFILVFFNKEKMGTYLSVVSGIILDSLSFLPFGIFTLTLFLSSFSVKRISLLFQTSNIFSFLILLIIFLSFYRIFLGSSKFIFEFVLAYL